MLVLAAVVFAAPPPVDFRRDILPVLAEHCFHCHGPDDAARQANFRIDTKDGAFKKKRDRAMIVPGKSDESEVVSRVRSKDPDEQMPPPDSNRKLTAAQIETLTRWIDEGAAWGTHWAYEPLPKAVPVPDAAGRSAIDKFVADRLKKEGLTPAAAANKSTWLRRVTLDLTGLPPTLKELDAFLVDTSPAAFESVVDRLLASPRYGERMAADWLDVARFADTHGYQSDRHRPMSAYRDWVIAAFNGNQKYDDFARDQLAGDLIANASKPQRLATAFNRLHMQTEEGGVVEEEFRVAYVADRVNTFGTAFLAQTFECTRCHDHKYDPLTQKDYYSLFAFFQNIDESGQTSYFTPAVPVPTLLLSTVEQDNKLRLLTFVELRADNAWQNAVAAVKGTATTVDAPKPVAAFAFDELAANKTPARGDAKLVGNGHDGPHLVPGKVGKAVSLSGENGFSFPGVGHFSRAEEFSLSLWIKPERHSPRQVVLHHSKAPIDAGSRGYEVLLEHGRVAFGLHHMWPGNSVKVATTAAVPAGEWSHVTVTYDGSSQAKGCRIFVNGRPAVADVVRDALEKEILYGPGKKGEPELAVGFRFRDNGFKGGAVDELQVFDRALTAAEAAVVAGVAPKAEDLSTHFALTHPTVRKAAADLHEARGERAAFVEPIPEAMVMREMPAPKPAFLLKRGNYDSPGDPVTATTPKVLPPFPAAAPKNRLGLTQWLTDPDHPLFARVFVNRLWQQMFGAGLVETSDNFGTTGSPPTHPGLLDWLARDFTRDYDVKRALKQIALSDTYRQSSAATVELKQKDPANALLARGPSRRLTAEMLRDQALFVSGLLTEKLGGPSVYPYQPEGLWNEAMGRPHYPQSTGPDLYRRGLYTYWKRTAPPPQALTFDAADRSNCAARRQATTTPLQALVLLNDPTFVEAARKLGERMLNEGGPRLDSQVAWAFRTVLGRDITDKEERILRDLYSDQKDAFRDNPAEAKKLLAVGAAPADPKRDPAVLAAATAVAIALMNHDAAVHRR